MAKTYLSGERIQGSSTGAKTTAEFEETFSGTGHTSDGTTVNGWTANDVSVLRYEGMSGTGLTGVANFDGDDKVTLGGSASDYNFLTTGFSIAFWVKPDAIANNNTVFDNTNGSASANGIVIRWEDSEKKIRLMIGSSGSGGGSCLSDGNEMELHEWQHLAFTYDGTTARIYRNGSEIKNAAITSHTGTAANVPAIGDCVSGGDSGYDGAIQDFVITNDTLTTGEITSLTNGSVASANLNNQKIHYPLTANFNDSSGGLGNGTASGNAAISTTTKGKQGDNLHFNITNITAASSGQELSYDLQHADALNGNNANATKWTLRFKLNMVTKSGTGQNGIQFSMGLSSHTANVARDFMGILILQSHQSAGNRVVNGTVNNNYPQNQGTSSNYLGGSSQTIELTSGSDWWVDITRDGDDCTTTIYTDEFSGTSYTLTKTVTSIADLRYLVFQNASGEATFVGSVDDIQFYDGGMTQDDKSTITNVPAGTRYEETDTRKIYRCKLTGDPKFDFSNNTGWTQYGTGVSIDTTDEEMDYNPAAASADKRLSYDLGAGNVSDTAWTLRWTFTPTATTSPAGFIMPTLISSNSAYGSGTTVDQIACRFGEQQGGSPAGDFLQLEYTNGASLDSGTGATPCVTASMNTTYYCEMLRNSTTSITLNVRTGSHTGSHATNSPETITNMPSAVGGLRYIMFSNYPPSPSGRSMTSTIDDLEFFNGNNTASGTKVSWVEKGTA